MAQRRCPCSPHSTTAHDSVWIGSWIPDIKHNYMNAKNCELEQKYINAHDKASLGSILGVGISFILCVIKAVTINSIDAGSSTGVSNKVTAIGYIATNDIACSTIQEGIQDQHKQFFVDFSLWQSLVLALSSLQLQSISQRRIKYTYNNDTG